MLCKIVGSLERKLTTVLTVEYVQHLYIVPAILDKTEKRALLFNIIIICYYYYALMSELFRMTLDFLCKYNERPNLSGYLIK